MNTNTTAPDGVVSSTELGSLMGMSEAKIDAELRALGIDPATAARKAGDAIDRAVIRAAGYVCGMCGRSTPHEHTPEEVAIFRNGIKQALKTSPLHGKYGEVLAPFLALMDAELHANSSKGDRPGWLSMSPDVALLEIYWHTAKLSAAVKNRDAALIREHSADVSNMAMMLLDVCGGLNVAAPTDAAISKEQA